jgi:iron complex outermembrane receptor protein
LALSIALALAIPVAHAQGASASTAAPIAIKAQPLAEALNDWARQTRLQIIVQQGLVAGKTAPAVVGQMTAQQALERLLAGSGLRADTEGAAFVVKALPPPAPTSTPAGAATLPAVTVTDSRESAYGPVGGFVARRSATATKTDTPLSETPQSVSVVPREQIEAQAADSVDQALQYSAGVSMFEGGGTRSVGTRFVVRGFSTLGQAALYLDGSKLPTNSLTGAMEPYHFERIELLKGPASILYGQATPGGVINLVGKRPTDEPLREAELQAGSWNRKQVAVDLAGPATEDKRIRYRLTALARDSDSMVKAYRNDRASLAGTLEWQLADSTLLTLRGTYDDTRAAFDPGKPLEGTLLPNPAGRISRQLFVGERGVDDYRGKGHTLGYALEHSFNSDWKIRQNVLAYDRKIDWTYSSPSAQVNPANPRLGTRVAVLRADDDKGFSVDNQLHGIVRHGNVEHKLLLGLDYAKSSFQRAQSVGTLAPLDLFAPVYGAAPTYLGSGSSTSRIQQAGLYMQDQIKVDEHWIAVIGGRYDTTRNDAGSGTASEKSHAFTPRVGLMYAFGNGLTPYYSYSRSFMPTPGADFQLNRFKPTTGVQHEVGIKYEPPGANASVTVAAYQIKQRNSLTPDPVNTGYLVQTGETRSRGIEIEARAEVNRQLTVIAALGTTNAVITRSNQGNLGDRPTAVPRNTLSVWGDYKVAAVPGLSLGLGLRRVGQQQVNRMAVPSFTVYDAAVRYQWNNWQFALNLKNLTDKTYVAACPSVCYYGEQRNVLLTARYHW